MFLCYHHLNLYPMLYSSSCDSQGAQEVFQELPHEYIEPDHLPKVVKKGCKSILFHIIQSFVCVCACLHKYVCVLKNLIGFMCMLLLGSLIWGLLIHSSR